VALVDWELDGLWRVTRRLPADYTPYGQEERWADEDRGYPDCSCGCRRWRPLWDSERPGPDTDWGVCTNPASHRAGLLTFEHQGCFAFEPEQSEQ
jgi:hypothetical protein